MTMQKARLKALRNNRYVFLATSKHSCKRRNRVTRAIASTWTLKDTPEHVREMITERACLRAEIIAITERERGKKKSDASVFITQKLRQIDIITSRLELRRLHG
ncbi:hypothetical protein [Enterobacter bugandensis]|uniref:hypothetical protein n=1 Tax=Enterobacter bugandensis TaxID=881260 RepID=UPI002A82D869|nr:hypothetical protein [Enterobacter bugandensis]